MRVAVAGVHSVVGRSTRRALLDAGHDLVEVSPATTVRHDDDELSARLDGCDALVNLTGQIPVGFGFSRRRDWRAFDRARADGTRTLVAVAEAAGVRRVVHQSSSFVYADQGSAWVSERSPVCVTTATEPTSVGEMAVQDYSSTCRTGVVLRLGQVLGAGPRTRWALRSAAAGRAVCAGSPDGWAHVVHADDVGEAVLAALDAPSGVYNVGAEPVLREDLAAGLASAVGRDRGGFAGPVLTRLGGRRLEPLTRSVRVSSERFGDTTGWAPRHETFGPAWFATAALEVAGR